MTKAGLRAATRFGSRLPAFSDQAEAEHALFRERDALLGRLNALAGHQDGFQADYSPESLKGLEHWYFELADGAAFGSIDLDAETFERIGAMYFGEVVVRNAPAFEWFVAEFAFEPGRYEIGVRSPQLQVMLTRLAPVPRERNKRELSIWRLYRKYTGL